MTLRNVYATPPANFAQEVSRKISIRWFVVKYSVQAMCFWLVAIIAGAWMVHFGLAWLAICLLAVWTYFALPSIIVQAQLIIDVVSYGIMGQMHFFPLMQELVESGEAIRRRNNQSPRARKFFGATHATFMFIAMTVPTIGAALWCAVVLSRVPEHVLLQQPALGAEPARIPTTIVVADIRRAVRLTRAIEESAASDYAGKQFARAM